MKDPVIYQLALILITAFLLLAGLLTLNPAILALATFAALGTMLYLFVASQPSSTNN